MKILSSFQFYIPSRCKVMVFRNKFDSKVAEATKNLKGKIHLIKAQGLGKLFGMLYTTSKYPYLWLSLNAKKTRILVPFKEPVFRNEFESGVVEASKNLVGKTHLLMKHFQAFLIVSLKM